MMRLGWLAILGWLWLATDAAGQSAAEFAGLKRLAEPEKAAAAPLHLANAPRNGLQWFMGGLFKGYKLFISSQDVGRCSFHPSCSEYGMLAVKKKGLVVGGLLTMDRLTRCHGRSRWQYEEDSLTGVLQDPVR